MKKLLLTICTIFLPSSAFGPCGHSPEPAPTPEPTPTACQRACNNLFDLQCPEGLHKNCAADCQDAMDSKLSDMKPECLAKATSQDEARSCKTVHCSTNP